MFHMELFVRHGLAIRVIMHYVDLLCSKWSYFISYIYFVKQICCGKTINRTLLSLGAIFYQEYIYWVSINQCVPIPELYLHICAYSYNQLNKLHTFTKL